MAASSSTSSPPRGMPWLPRPQARHGHLHYDLLLELAMDASSSSWTSCCAARRSSAAHHFSLFLPLPFSVLAGCGGFVLDF
nr:unnamed protein product [Digitaria exilis]